MRPREEFVELLTENCRINGLDELSSKIIAILYIEPKEMSLDGMAKETGYSLSAVSTALKFLERIEMIKRIKKPKSRKLYFHMEKCIMDILMQFTKKKYEKILLPTKDKLPKIIERYRKERSKNSKEELKILEDYYNQLLTFEKIMKNLIAMLEKLKR